MKMILLIHRTKQYNFPTGWYHKRALHFLTQGRYLEATEYNNRSLALYDSNADFHALGGKLSALQGEFREAVSSCNEHSSSSRKMPLLVIICKRLS